MLKHSRQRAVVLGCLAVSWSMSALAATDSIKAAHIDELQALGLNGTGIVTGQIESYQPDATNPIFNGVSVTLRNNPDLLTDNHATQVAGIMVGNQINTLIPSQFGIAPGASHFSSPWTGTAASLDSAGTYMSTNPIARVINMSAGDVLGTRDASLSRVIDSYASASDASGKTSQLYVIAETNDGWDSTIPVRGLILSEIPTAITTASPLAQPAAQLELRNGTTNYSVVSGFSGQGTDTDNPFNPDIVAPGGLIPSSVANWKNNDGVNGDLTDDNSNGQVQIDLSVVIPFFGLRAGQLTFQGGGTQGTIADLNGNGVFDIGDLRLAGMQKNFNDNNGNGIVDAGDSFIRTNPNDAGDDPDPTVATSSGTSFAAPHVSGAAALLMQKANTTPGLSDALDHRVMKSLLMNTTDKLVQDKAGMTWLQSPAYTSPSIVLDDQLVPAHLTQARPIPISSLVNSKAPRRVTSAAVPCQRFRIRVGISTPLPKVPACSITLTRSRRAVIWRLRLTGIGQRAIRRQTLPMAIWLISICFCIKAFPASAHPARCCCRSLQLQQTPTRN